MPVHAHNPHGTTVYAPPVTCRAASPASSIGTHYDDDTTSDQELEMTKFEFERLCEGKIKLSEPRPQEEWAEREVLVKDPARGKGDESEQALFESIIRNLRTEIKRLDDEEIYERTMFKGSQIGLEAQPPTSDIDKIMRSMMGSALSLNPSSSPLLLDSTPANHLKAERFGSEGPPPHQPTQPAQSTQPAVSKGPWDNYGKKPPSLGSHMFPVRSSSRGLISPTSSVLAPASSIASNLTSTTTTTPSTIDDMLVDADPVFLSKSNLATSKRLPSKKKIATLSEGSTSGTTIVGGKRTRNGTSIP
ncbi:hypothetical protein FA15DRAFT_666221 [Coprinopsis marcescibilis]|uniref:Uncharacterized protein n=1 Tax=Coprinopsis marcescibilis TaxID=230819 RepID=A0A5C3L5X3_COPMA|nr:hypothetical protein FA15DRAFT_666221 [Coprinopsis marcescibilis]